MTRTQCVLLVATVMAGCATERGDTVVANQERASVVQIGFSGSKEFVACSRCDTQTRKTLNLPAATPSVAPVTNLGATEHRRQLVSAPKVQVYSVLFDTNKASLNDLALVSIAQVIKAYRKNPSSKVSILGRADPTGHEKANERLAGRRAAAVRKALIKDGVVSSDIIAVARRPCCDGDKYASAEALRMQRRADIEVTISEKHSSTQISDDDHVK